MNSGSEIVKPSVKEARLALRQVLSEFEEMVGGRAALAAGLSLLDLEPKAEMLVGMLGDSASAPASLEELCRRAGLKANHLMMLWRESQVAVAKGQVYEGLPKVMQTVVKQAREGEITCPKCRGGDPDCEKCGGEGVVWHQGSLPHQQMVLEMTNVLPKGGGVQVNVQQKVNVGGSGGSFFDRFVRSSDEVAYAVDAVVTEVKDDA